MIELFEQYGYLEKDRCVEVHDEFIPILQSKGSHKKCVSRKGNDELCYLLECLGDSFHFQTSYFVGIDWIVENQLPIYIQPKQNKESLEVNYIGMLLEALREPENLKHLDDLIHIDFHKPYIPITQKQDILSPFLIAQFLQILKKIVRKGLKKSYYTVVTNLNARIKGKILVGRNIKENLAKGRHIQTICQYQEFGINCDENKILKKAYQFSRRFIQSYKSGFDSQPLLQLMNYIHPAFENVSEDIDIQRIKIFKSNPLFKEYDQAVKLALLILKRYSYNITKVVQQQIMTPPFWIDMSKLFELYVYRMLRNVFSSDEVKYHLKAKYQELDFLIRSKDDSFIFVIDTKYKPKYHDENVRVEDIRQVCGYARLEKVYKELKISDQNRNIDCLIIYPHQECDKKIEIEHFVYNEGNDMTKIRKEHGYVNFYKLGIRLPERETNK
jgi:5-methylcytosine-specific restriction enzyme subunit McrC